MAVVSFFWSSLRLPVLVACALPALWVFGAGEAEALPQVIDFEGLNGMTFFSPNPIPPDSRLSDAFLLTHGVRFSSGSPYVAVVALGVGHATSGVNGIGGSTPDGILTYDRQNPVVITFFDPKNPSMPSTTDFVSVRGDRAGAGQPITLNAFDLSGQLIASTTTTDSGGATLSISMPGIHSVQFLGTVDNAGVALDDLTFNPVGGSSPPAAQQIPTLSTWGFLTLAVLLALAAARRLQSRRRTFRGLDEGA